jgi:hypothetical protein
MAATQLDRRLLAYSLTAGAALASGEIAAGIVYGDVNPDQVYYPGDAVTLDLDGGGIDFYAAVLNPGTNTSSSTTGTGSLAIRRIWIRKRLAQVAMVGMPIASLNRIAVHGELGATYGGATFRNYQSAEAMSFGRLISTDAGGWQAAVVNACRRQLSTTYMSSHTGGSGWNQTFSTKSNLLSTGPWLGAAERFIGLRWDVGGQARYGWIRLTVNATGTQMTVHDYAYREEFDTPILAGDLGGSMAQGRETQTVAADAGLPGNVFSAKPKVYGIYTDPIKDPGGLKPRKATVKVLDKPSPDNVLPAVRGEWTKKVTLYNKADFKAAYKAGTRAMDFLLANPPQGPVEFDLWLDSKELGAAADIPNVFLFPPQIAGVFHGVTDERILSARAGEQIVVRGSFFGKKVPKAWLEYPSGGAIKMLKLKVVKPLAYADINGKLEKNAMQPASGASRVVYQVPDKLPVGWVHGGAAGGTHHLVLDNGVGIAVADFDTRP